MGAHQTVMLLTPAEQEAAEDAAALFVAAIQHARRSRTLLLAAADAKGAEVEALTRARDALLSRHPSRRP